MAFIESPAVTAFLEIVGEDGLPITLVGGNVVLTHRYPTREELQKWTGVEAKENTEKKTNCCSSNCGC